MTALILRGAQAMKRYRYLPGIVLSFVMGAFPMGAHAGGKSNPTYDGAVAFGSQLLYLDDGCLSVDGTVTSGTFFDNLKRMDLGGRFQYKKQGRIVTEYPASLTTSIRLVGDKCAAELSNAPSAVFSGNSFTVKFSVEWKDGMELRPATLSPVVAHCVGSTSVAIPHQDFDIPSVTCQLTVDSKGVPLADHLIVSVFGADGSRLTRLSAAP
jgi:hypothetical protein